MNQVNFAAYAGAPAAFQVKMRGFSQAYRNTRPMVEVGNWQPEEIAQVYFSRPLPASRTGEFTPRNGNRLAMNLVMEDHMPAQLRVYQSPDESAGYEGPEPTVRVSLGELLPLVALAHRHNYLWLQDFLDDEVAISPDLDEVLRAFRCYRPAG